MDVQSLLAWNIRRLRTARNISQDDLALAANVERAYVGHLERSTRNPTIATIAKLAVALEVDVAELFVEPREGEKPPKPLKPGRRKK